MPPLIPPIRLPSPYPEMDTGDWNSYQILENFTFLTANITAIRRSLGGGTWSNPMTALGDLVRGQADGLPTRLPIGTTGQVLTVATGVPVWATSTALTNPMTTLGDLITGDVAGVPKRLGIATDGDVLTLVSGEPVWETPAGGTLVWPLLAPDGTGSAPSYSFAGHPTTGLYYDAVQDAPALKASGGGTAYLTSFFGPALEIRTADETKNVYLGVDGTVPEVYLGTTGSPIRVYMGAAPIWEFQMAGSFVPGVDNAVDLGDASHAIRHGYVGTSLNFGITAAPATPATGRGVLYQKSDKKLYWKDDTGTETALW